jgi:hypothetical protein
MAGNLRYSQRRDVELSPGCAAAAGRAAPVSGACGANRIPLVIRAIA